MQSVSRGSFTLLELLIVVVIIGLIYSAFTINFTTKRVEKGAGLEAIEAIVAKYEGKEVALRCIKGCRECFLFLDGRESKKIEIPFRSEPKVYGFGLDGILHQVAFTPLFDDNGNPQEVCFAYDRYPNGSSSSYIVAYEGAFYLFDAYWDPPRRFASLQEAKEHFDPRRWIPLDGSEFNF